MNLKKEIKLNKKFKKILTIILFVYIDAYILAGIYYQGLDLARDILRPRCIVITAHSFSPTFQEVLQNDEKRTTHQEEQRGSTSVRNKVSGSSSYEDLIKKYFKKDWKIAYAIMQAESQGDAGRN